VLGKAASRPDEDKEQTGKVEHGPSVRQTRGLGPFWAPHAHGAIERLRNCNSKRALVVHHMLPAAAVALAALVAIDWYFLDGKYVSAVEALARSLIHFVVG
jgi:hypothetical protein